MIEIRDLKKSYGRHPALRGIDLTVERGEMIAVSAVSRLREGMPIRKMGE